MRVAFVIPRLDPSLGGVERYAFGLACGLARRGLEVTAFTATPPAQGLARPAALSIAPIGVPPGPRATRHRRFDAAARVRVGDLARWSVVQGFGPTTVHTLQRVGGGSHAAYVRAMARYEPRWWRRACVNPAPRARIARQRATLRTPGLRLFANSERTRRDVCADYGLAPERLPVIHNGVDLAAFRPAPGPVRRASRAHFGLAQGEFALAFVGSGFARKGLRFAIEMVATVRELGVPISLLVAGRGRAAAYRRLARRRGAGGAVRFLGHVPDVASLYAACDALALPSVYEPFGMAALEAMACGLPVLVSAESGVAEVLADGREGCLLERPDQVERGAAFLRTLARDEAARRAFGERARHTARALDLERHVDCVLALYRSQAAAS